MENLDAISERLDVMLHQESTSYKCPDYLGTQPPPQESSPVRNEDNSSTGANEIWREKICKWTYEVVDHFDFNREIVSVSLSYLDRFLSTRQVNHKTFQLAAMTTLYLAIKLYEQRTLKISSLIELSRGYFRVEHIVTMEKYILRDLSWRVHPPTPQCFAQNFVSLLPFGNDTLNKKIKQEITELSHFLMELSICDYFFVTRNPSSVALASILNALDIIALPRSLKKEFESNIKAISPLLHLNSIFEVNECRPRLKCMFQHSQKRSEEESQQRIETVSPTSVSTSLDIDESSNNHGKPRKTSKTTQRTSPSCGKRS